MDALCSTCSGYSLDHVIAEGMDISRACLCFKQDHDIAMEDPPEED